MIKGVPEGKNKDKNSILCILIPIQFKEIKNKKDKKKVILK